MKKLHSIAFLIFFCFACSLLNAQILTVTPDTVLQGKLVDIEVTAENVNFSQGTNLIHLQQGVNGFNTDNCTPISATSVVFHTSFSTDLPTGDYSLSIWNFSSGNTFTKENAIFVKPNLNLPSLLKISPDSARQGDMVVLTIKGTNTNFANPKIYITVYLEQNFIRINPVNINPIDSVTLEASFEFSYSNLPVLYAIHVQNDLDGNISLPGAFKLNPGPETPSIHTIVPDTLTAGQILDIEVTSEYMNFQQGTNLIQFIQGNTNLYVSNSVANSQNSLLMEAIFNKDNPLGYYNLSIVNTFTGITLKKDSAIYLKPDLTVATIKNVHPDTARQGNNLYIEILATNTHFDNQKIINSVYLKNASKIIYPTSKIIEDSVRIKASFEFTYAHPPGEYSVNVFNDLDGLVSLDNGFKLLEGPAVPVIISVSPDTIGIGQTLDIQVTAANINFSQGTSVVSLKQGDTQIFMNYSAAIDSNLLTANITISNSAQPGDYNLIVWNPSIDITLIANQTLIKENAFYLKSGTYIGLPNNLQYRTVFYPNPVSDYLYLTGKYRQVQIINLSGQIVLESKLEDKIDVRRIQKGIYLLKLFSDKQYTVSKLIIE